jgi:methyl-accepting chemotaxis protein
MNTAVSQMDKVTQQNASSAEQSAAASEELSAQAEGLTNVVEDLTKLVGVASNLNGQHTNVKGKGRPSHSFGLRKQHGEPVSASTTHSHSGHSSGGTTVRAGREESNADTIPMDNDSFKEF